MREFFTDAMVGGVLVVLPIYLALLLLFKGVQAVRGLLQPVTAMLPESLPVANLLALAAVLVGCFIIGLAVRTRAGQAVRECVERTFFERFPGYALFRSLTHRLVGETEEQVWQPALAEIEDALVPAFIIEEHDDGRLTVFVPSVPTPLAGAVYVLERARVHPTNVSFTQAVQTISRWGSGSKLLVAAMGSDATLQRNRLAQSPPIQAHKASP
jgi:uncharacterized membrane protein